MYMGFVTEINLFVLAWQAQAEIMTVWSDENEVDSAEPGENVKLKLKNVEEDVSFILSLVSYFKICLQICLVFGRGINTAVVHSLLQHCEL